MDSIELIRVGSMKTHDDERIDYEALNAASQFGHQVAVKYILSENCQVNERLQPTKTANTQLHRAVLLNDRELVDGLLKMKASVVAVDSYGNTPLHLAFIRKYYEIIDRILDYIQETSNHENVNNKYDLSHLHIACTRNNEVVIREYLENGAKIHDKVSEKSLVWAGYDAMNFAVTFQSSIATKVLLEIIDKKTKMDDDTVESMVILAEAYKITDDFYGERCYEKIWEFHEACLQKNNVAVIKKFIKYEKSVNTHIQSDALQYPGWTPLHFAVESESIQNVRLLVSRGAEVDRINCAQMSPLHLAIYKEDPKKKSAIVDVLYRSLKDKMAIVEDENLLSFFHVAITRNKIRLVQEFLDDGEKVNQRVMLKTPNFSGYAPLHFAVRYGLQSMASYLIRRGANMNQVSGDGTPLDIACRVKHEGLIKLLKANRVGA